MVWKCAECNVREGGQVMVDAVCHHCGKPLCRHHQIVLVDEAFSTAEGPIDRKAFHCRECQRHYHPRTASVSA